MGYGDEPPLSRWPRSESRLRGEIEAGRKALFDGPAADLPRHRRGRVESAQVVDIMEARMARNSATYFARRDAGKAVARG